MWSLWFAVAQKFDHACSVVIHNMADALRKKQRVDYNMLNRQCSADFYLPCDSKKRKYRVGSKIYQVERLISIRKSFDGVHIFLLCKNFTQWKLVHWLSAYFHLFKLNFVWTFPSQNGTDFACKNTRKLHTCIFFVYNSKCGWSKI